MTKKLIKVIDCLSKELAKHTIDNPLYEAEFIVSTVTSIPRLELYLHKDRIISNSELECIEKVSDKRIIRVPLQYIFGYTYFMSRKFLVNEAVLIPRLETELLVQKIIDNHKDESRQIRVLDIGTGSGIIAISLSAYFPDWLIDAVDISEEAIITAERNSSINQTNVSFFVSDLFEAVEEKYNIIVSNPPYISPEDFMKLPCEIKDYEPDSALFASENGLIFYRKILENALQHLTDDGVIYFEIGDGQASEINKIASKNGFITTEVDKDYNQFERVLKIKRR